MGLSMVRPDCQYDEADIQAVGRVELFRSGSLGTPITGIIGSNQFEQIGYHVTVAEFNGNDVIAVSSASSG